MNRLQTMEVKRLSKKAQEYLAEIAKKDDEELLEQAIVFYSLSGDY